MNPIKHLFAVDFFYIIKHSITYMHSAYMSGMWLMNIMTLDCTLQRALGSYTDVVTSYLYKQAEQVKPFKHCVEHAAYTRHCAGFFLYQRIFRKFSIQMYRIINISMQLWTHMGRPYSYCSEMVDNTLCLKRSESLLCVWHIFLNHFSTTIS